MKRAKVRHGRHSSLASDDPPSSWLALRERLVEGRYLPSGFVLRERLGKGRFGTVFRAISGELGDREVALKLQSAKQRGVKEMLVYRMLESCPYVPRVMWQPSQPQALVMELLTATLDGRPKQGARLGPREAASLGTEIVGALRHLHDRGWVHADIKPGNIGRGADGRWKLFDFNLSRPYVSAGTHIEEYTPVEEMIIGTPRYCSARTSVGVPPSRRDDLEALAYTLCAVTTGSLPWDNLVMKRKRSYDFHRRLRTAKEQSTTPALAGAWPALRRFIAYSRALRFEEEPDYASIATWLGSGRSPQSLRDGGGGTRARPYASATDAWMERAAIQL